MVNFEELKAVMDDSGMTVTAIATKSGMLRETLYNRFKGRGDFTANEIAGLSKALHLTPKQRDNIFFSSEVE